MMMSDGMGPASDPYWQNQSYERLRACADERDRLRGELARLRTARPIDEWHEDIGPVLWWRFPVDEPPYAGSPLDTDWPGYHTHWTPIEIPIEGA
jgi:hypothetical protein